MKNSDRVLAIRKLVYLLIIVFSAVTGILSRSFGDHIPPFLATYTGDTFWAVAGYFVLRLFFDKMSSIKTAITAYAVSIVIEVSQLYQSPWINSVRNTLAGGLILGFGFKWSDFLCYLAGVIIALMVDSFLINKKTSS